MRTVPAAALFLLPVRAQAADGGHGIAIACFMLVIAGTLLITYLAARRTRSANDFYAAGGQISGVQNGFAIAGDFMSAATLLGIAALIFLAGFDAVVYMLTPMIGLPLLLLLITDKLRELGKYTFTDVICARLAPRPMRVLVAVTALTSALMYLIAQMVGAGALIQVMFGVDYGIAVTLVGVLMVIYVSVGGMLATTWVQITKAVLLLAGVALLALLILWRFEFSLDALYDAALEEQPLLLSPGGLQLGLFSTLSLGLGLALGMMGSPHILMRFFTVPDPAAARLSAFVTLCAVGFVNLLLFFIIGAGAVALVSGDARFLDDAGRLIGGANMVTIHASEIVGGKIFLGFMSAVTFATILAVVAGLTIAGASAVSHDLYAHAFRDGRSSEREEILVSRISGGALGVIMIALGIAFEGQNIAYLVSLALLVAASTNFPLLVLSIYWRGLTTRGALAGGFFGLVSAILMVILGPAVWVDVLGHTEPIFPSAYPAMFSITIAFATTWLISITDRSARAAEDRRRFDALTS